MERIVMAEETITKEDISAASEKVAADEKFVDEFTVYELGFHILPTIAEEKIVEAFGGIKALIEKNKGIFIAEEAPKPMHLAYTIVKAEGGQRQKFDNTYFGWVKFEMSPEHILALKESLREHDSLLRVLLFKTARESTLAAKKVFFERPKGHVESKPLVKPTQKEKVKETISEEELDKTIEELMVE